MVRILAVSPVAIGSLLLLGGALEGCVGAEQSSQSTGQTGPEPDQALDGLGDHASLADGAAPIQPRLVDGGTDALDARNAPYVVSVTPGDKNVDVGRTGKVIVQFSDDMDESSIESGGLSVLLGTERVAGSYRIDGRFVTFDPDAPWVVAAKYTIAVTSAVKSAAGAHIATEWRVSFWVRDGIWARPSTFDGGSTDTPTGMSFEMDADGNGVLVWIATSTDTGKSTLRAARYEKGNGWGEPVQFATRPRAGETVSLSVKPDGQAAVGWIAEDSSVYCAWYDRDEDSWSVIATVRAEEGMGSAQSARALVNRSGRGLLTWSRPSQLWALPIRSDLEWDTAPYSLSTSGPMVGPPWVAINTSGDGMIVWSEDDGTGSSALWYSRYTRRSESQPLSRPELVPSGVSGVEIGDGRRIAVDAQGNGVLVWEKDLGDRSETWATTFAKAGSWGTGERIESLSGYSRNPSLAVDPSGSAVAVWAHLTAPERLVSRVRSSTYVPGSGWEAPVTVSKWVANDPRRVPPTPTVVLDRVGNGFATWHVPSDLSGDGQSHWMIARYLRGDFSASKRLDLAPVDEAQAVLATSPNGETVAVWFECGLARGCTPHYTAFQ